MKKIKQTMKRILLYSNEPDAVYGSCDEFRKAYEEYCKENEQEPEENGEFGWFNSEDLFNWSDFIEQIKCIDRQAYEFLLIGSSGTWQGRRPGGLIDSSLKALIEKATARVDYVSIYLENGAIEIVASHHDGTNYWTIHALNLRATKTINKWENELSEQELHEKLNKVYYWKKLEQ